MQGCMEKGNSNSHGARPVHLIIVMIKWIRTSRLSIKNSLSAQGGAMQGRPWGCAPGWSECLPFATLEATQGQIVSQSPTDATSSR